MSYLNCRSCGIELKKKNRQFCSSSCSATWSNIHYKKSKKRKKCSKCDSLISNTSRRLCEKHELEHKRLYLLDNLTLKEAIERYGYEDKAPAMKYFIVRQKGKTKFKHLKKLPCRNCGYSKHVELCHIKPINSFPEDTLLSIINSPDNVIQLCPNHHWEFDNGLLKIND